MSTKINVITEENGIDQLVDNHITMLVPESSALAKNAKDAINIIRSSFHNSMPYPSYDIDFVNGNELMSQTESKKIISDNNANMLVQLNTPGSKEKTIIVARVSENDVLDDFIEYINLANKISRENIRKAITKKAIEDLDFFVDFFSNLIKDKESNRFHGILYCRHRSESGKKHLKENSTKSFIQMLGEYRRHRNSDLKLKIKAIANTVNLDDFIDFLAKCSPKDQERFAGITPNELAEKSKIKIEIKSFNSIDRKNKNYGYYRLYLIKENEEPMLVHFKRKESCALYFLYLIDRKKQNRKVSDTNFEKYKGKFKRIYEKIYGNEALKYSAKAVFKLFNSENSQSKYKSFFKDNIRYIRKDIELACKELKESSSPFIINDIEGKLAALPKNITIPQELMDIL